MTSINFGFFDELRKLAATSREHMRAANILRLKNPIIHVDGEPGVAPMPYVTANEAGDQVVKFPQSMGPLDKNLSSALSPSGERMPEGAWKELHKGFFYPHEMEETAHANKLFKKQFNPKKDITLNDIAAGYFKNPERPTKVEMRRFKRGGTQHVKKLEAQGKSIFGSDFHGFSSHYSPIIPLNDLARVQNFGESNADSRARFGRNKEEIRAREARERGLGREFLQKRLNNARELAKDRTAENRKLIRKRLSKKSRAGADKKTTVTVGDVFRDKGARKNIFNWSKDDPYHESANQSYDSLIAASRMSIMRLDDMRQLRRQLPKEFRRSKFNDYFSGRRKMPKWLRKRVEELYFAKNPRGIRERTGASVDFRYRPDPKLVPVINSANRSIAATYGVDAKRFRR